MFKTIFLISFFLISKHASPIILAIKCVDGIVIGTDSLSSSGSIVRNRNSKKAFLLTPHTMICCADGEKDFYLLYEDLSDEKIKFELFNNEIMSTKAIVHYARQLIYSKYPKAHVIIAGSEFEMEDENFVLCEILPLGLNI
jgi:20S proteasome alpha/beta subunit